MNCMDRNTLKTRNIALIGMMGALAAVLMMIRFPLPFMPPFMDFDFASLPEIIGGFAMGPVAAVFIILVKILVKLVITGTSTAFTGEIQNVLLSCAYVLPAVLIYDRKKTKGHAVAGMAVGTLVCAVVAIFSNLYMIIPFYVNLFGMTMDENGGFVLPDSDNKKVSILNLIVSVINNQSEKYNIRDASLVLVSAKKGEGIDALKNALSCLCREYAADTDATIVTNLRHVEALQCASDALVRVRQGLASEIPTDLVSQDIREALYYLGSIVGEISTDEVLGRIFEGFCIGK